MEQWQLATLSFKMWGALSPTKEQLQLPSNLQSTTEGEIDPKKNDDAQCEQKKLESANQHDESQPFITTKRSIGQAEIESAYFKV